MIEVTKMKIGDYDVPIPHGLSELLSNCWTDKPIKNELSPEYERHVFKREGHFVTVLRKVR